MPGLYRMESCWESVGLRVLSVGAVVVGWVWNCVE